MPHRTAGAGRCIGLIVLLVGLTAGSARAQGVSPVEDATIRAQWRIALGAAAKAHGVSLEGTDLRGSADEKAAVYRDAIDRVSRNPLVVSPSFDRALIQDAVREADRQYIRQLAVSGIESRTAKSTDSRSSNPATQGLTERSGFSELLALALNGQSVVSSDATAVSLNLNALALVSLADPDVYSELYRYQQHGLARRFGGTITIGSKIPEKEITGLSSLPDFDRLLDAISWDVKVRVWGDKDPRSARWYPMTLGRGAAVTQLSAVIPGLVPIGDLTLVQSLLNERLGAFVGALKQQLARSPQLTAKIAGTHLTRETGKNKYSAALLFDVGMSAVDVTANASYSVTDDVSLGPDRLFQVKRFDFSAQLQSHLAPGAVAAGRTVDLGLGAGGTFFQESASLPVSARNTWKIFSTVDVPIGRAAKIPFSLIYSNDPNALTKSKYVSGLIGISYDFSAIGQLFGPGR